MKKDENVKPVKLEMRMEAAGYEITDGRSGFRE